jgi:nitrogen fixation NifU-like protein
MYQKELLEFAKLRKYSKEINSVSIELSESNPLCGDKINLQLEFQNEILTGAKVNYESCAIVNAASNIVLDHIMGKSKHEISSIIEDFQRNFLSEKVDLESAQNQEFKILYALKEFHSRKACVLLPFKAIKKIEDE